MEPNEINMLDATRDMITAEDREMLKSQPRSADAERWIPRLVAEVERLREQLKALEATRDDERG